MKIFSILFYKWAAKWLWGETLVSHISLTLLSGMPTQISLAMSETSKREKENVIGTKSPNTLKPNHSKQCGKILIHMDIVSDFLLTMQNIRLPTTVKV